MVTLVCDKEKREVTPEMAQDLLWIQGQMKIKGWELPKDSPYQYIGNALIKRSNTSDCKRKAKPKRDPVGDKPSRQA